MSARSIAVLKFGGSVLDLESSYAEAASEVYRFLRLGHRVVAVVSAERGATDRLLEDARRFGGEPDPAAVAELLAVGEARSVALLALALGRAGVPARPFDAARAGLATEGPILDAELVAVDAAELGLALDERPVAVLPGFVGRSAAGGTTLLGRGGSDLTALFLARVLGAERCRLVKDVDGLYERDPSGPGPAPGRFERVSWPDALRLDPRIVQRKAVRFAERHRLPFEVGRPGSGFASLVGEGPTRLAPPEEPRRPLRVALLGLGTVGLGVYRRLELRPERYEVVGVAVRSPRAHGESGVPPELLSGDPRAVARRGADVVVELLGGGEPAASIVAEALAAGTDVVTANKEIVARHGAWFEARAAETGARFLASASVGGAVPVLESLARLARERSIESLEGVVNGTTNYVLDAVGEGASFADAVYLAQAHGYAEADPSVDLDGTDAARKLAILARRAFGVDLPPGSIARAGIDGLDPELVRAARRAGKVVRLVASCRRTRSGLEARIAPETLAAGHPLAGTRGEENRILIATSEGTLALSGKGAGRWPTAESVLADLADLERERRASAELEEVGR